MNTTTLTFNTNSVFTTKEEYVAFRDHWKRLHADGFHTPVKHEYHNGGTYVKRDELNEYGNPRYAYVEGDVAYVRRSPLSTWHHLVFNFAIGRTPPVKAFGDRTERKVRHLKPQMYYTIRYGSKDFSDFGDTLTESQKEEIRTRIEAYLNSL